MRIIYIEDNVANVALMERICTLSHDDLKSFSDADLALQHIYPGSADLIFMDVHLGRHSINGLELTQLLRQKGVLEPIILITAYDISGYPRSFLSVGFNDLVPKPVSVQEMLDLLNTYRPNVSQGEHDHG